MSVVATAFIPLAVVIIFLIPFYWFFLCCRNGCVCASTGAGSVVAAQSGRLLLPSFAAACDLGRPLRPVTRPLSTGPLHLLHPHPYLIPLSPQLLP